LFDELPATKTFELLLSFQSFLTSRNFFAINQLPFAIKP